MKLALYVHDFSLEVGHSNSLIELVRHLPNDILANIEKIEVISYTASPLKELFPKYQGQLCWKKVPFDGIQPSLFKSIFFQIWTFLYNRFFQEKNTYRIGIGICSLDVHGISIQFIHHQWTKMGLGLENNYPLRKFYKKILFSYYQICENFLFRRPGVKLFSPASFMTEFLRQKYSGIQADTIYSGVNLNRFELNMSSKKEIKMQLVPKYPILKELDTEAPIYLFAGAYERKGLDKALELLKSDHGAQFLVLGSPSMGRITNWPTEIKVFQIKFTSEISSFYSLADTFIFPTLYEPFGLVLFEAMAMGLSIVTNQKDVGASELLKGLPEVYFADDPNFQLPKVLIKNVRDRQILREDRITKLGDVSWEKAGKELGDLLFSSLNNK